MVRLLLHSADAVYDSTTHEYTFQLDRRIRRPTKLRVQKAHYSKATGSAHPLVVYLESNALSQLILNKHTLKLKSTSHENGTEIIATLGETHTKGRYNLERDVRTFKTNPDEHLRNIDIRFTNNGTVLAKSSTGAGDGSSGGQGSGPAGTVTDADIVAITGLKLFQDMKPNTLLNSSYANTPNVGDTVRYIYQNAGALQSMVFSGYGDFTVAAWGQGRGVTSTVSWNYAVDGTMPNKWSGYIFTYVWGMKAPQNQSGTIMLFNHRGLIVDLISGSLNIYDAAGNAQNTNIPLLPLKDYLITVSRVSDQNGDGIDEFNVTVENLESNAKSTATVNCGQDPTNQTNWWFSYPSQHFWDSTGILGPMIAFESADAGDIQNAEDWIRQEYDGQTAPEEEEEEAPDTGLYDAEWFVELDIEQE